MNILRNRNLLALLLLAAVAILPGRVSAANYLVQSTGIGDETLFIILVTVAIFQALVIAVIANVIKALAGNPTLWKKKSGKVGAAVVTGILLLIGAPAQAAEVPDFDALVTMDDTAFLMLITLNLFLFASFLYLVSKLNGLMNMIREAKGIEIPASFMTKLNEMLTDTVPIENEAEVELDHEYDGIRELDNNLPPWWLWGFYFSIVCAVVYFVNFHIAGTGDLQLVEYQKEMEAAELAKKAFLNTQENAIDESNLELLADAGSLKAGASTFKLYCAACHGASGGSNPGGVGPNLTDDYWIHGGDIASIFKTIKYGVPEKGMVSWQAQLSPNKMLQVSSYIKSIRGTNPVNAKEPQGELYEEIVPEEVPSDSTKAEGDITMSADKQ